MPRSADRGASQQLGVENGEPFEGGNVAEALIGADEVLEGGHAMEMQTNDLISPPCDVGREKSPQAGEFGWVERSG